MTAELVGTVPRMSALHAQQLINRSWARIRDSRLWSFQFVADAQLFVPYGITGGSVSATFGSTQIVADASAAAAFNAVATANPPLASPTLGVGRQIRVGSTNGISTPTGPNYNIVAWDGASKLTIDRPYGEATVSRAAYQVLKCYYAPPAPPPFRPPSLPHPRPFCRRAATSPLRPAGGPPGSRPRDGASRGGGPLERSWRMGHVVGAA